MTNERADIPGLTGLRFVAAASIAIGHFTIGFTLLGFHPQLTLLGMPLFFCLSGFVIHYVYATDLSRSWAPAAREFALARFSRIYPLFGFLLLYFVLFSQLNEVFKARPWVAASYLTTTGSWWYWSVGGLLMEKLPYGWSWSISTEAFFYVAYAVGLYRISKVKSPYGCLLALIGLCLAAYGILYLTFTYSDQWESYILERQADFISRQTNFANSFYRWFIYISPYFHMFEFIGGVLVCQLFLAMRERRIELGRLGGEAIAWFGIIWISGFLGVCIYVMDRGTEWSALQFIAWLHMTFLLAPGCLALILALAIGGCSISRLLSVRWAVYLGTISYSIYLCHLMLMPLFSSPQPGTSNRLRLAVTLGMIVVVSTGLYALVEVPAKRAIRALWPPRFISPQHTTLPGNRATPSPNRS